MKSVTVDYATAYQRAQALASAVSEATEGNECSLQLALTHSVGQLMREAEKGGAAALCGVEWGNALLWQLAGSLHPGNASVQAQDAILMAIASVQEALGVAAKDRAWRDDGGSDDAPNGADEFAASALALVPMLRPLVEQHPEADVYVARLDALATAIDSAMMARSGSAYVQRSEQARRAAEEVYEGWESPTMPNVSAVCGLYRGIVHSLQDGEWWIREEQRHRQGEDSPARKRSKALRDLPGEDGERSAIALTAGLELGQTAAVLSDLAVAGHEPGDRNRVQAHLLGRMRRLAGVVMSAMDDDDTVDGLWERMAD
jgi:hypothetical protein